MLDGKQVVVLDGNQVVMQNEVNAMVVDKKEEVGMYSPQLVEVSSELMNKAVTQYQQVQNL